MKQTQITGIIFGDWPLGRKFKSVISEHMLQIKFMGTSCEIALRWMPQITFDDKSRLI